MRPKFVRKREAQADDSAVSAEAPGLIAEPPERPIERGLAGPTCAAVDRDTGQSRGFGFVTMASIAPGRAFAVHWPGMPVRRHRTVFALVFAGCAGWATPGEVETPEPIADVPAPEQRRIPDAPPEPDAPRSAARLAAGGWFACAIRDDESVWCWGAGLFAPLRVDGIDAPIDLAAGSSTGCVVTTDHKARCFTPAYDTSTRRVLRRYFVDTIPLGDVVQVAVGHTHQCARRGDGSVWCWGGNQHGQLGDGTRVDRTAPVQVRGVADATDLAISWNHACARVAAGAVRCWGHNASGQLGDGTLEDRPLAVQVPRLTDVAELRVGMFGACVRLADGTGKCWGTTPFNWTESSTIRSKNQGPGVHAAPQLRGVTQFAFGNREVCGRTKAGLLRCACAEPGTPACFAVAGARGVAEVAIGDAGGCIRSDTGGVSCWGGNSQGQLGRVTDRRVPTLAEGFAGATQLGLDELRTCARMADGTVACAGAVSSPYDFWAGSMPVPLPLSGIGSVAAVFTGGGGPIGMIHDDGSVKLASPFEHLLPHGGEPLRGAVEVRLGWSFNAARMADGRVVAWDIQPHEGIRTILRGASRLALQEDHACALTLGDVRCWGKNDAGQLGDGTTVTRVRPAKVLLARAVDVAVGRDFTCAVLADARVACWGGNASGQLGDGARAARRRPAIVPGLADVVQIALGFHHACARLRDGDLRCWGDNLDGQLGDGTNDDRSTPTPVALTDVVDITGGGGHTCARRGDGSVWCWGDDDDGQLGVADTPASRERTLLPVVFP